jgi:hypothetical protein
VYGIVKQTGATVDVESEVGVDTGFILRFPSSRGLRRRAADDVIALRCIRDKMPDVKVLVASEYTSPGKTTVLRSARH